jgi:hypothetical protein
MSSMEWVDSHEQFCPNKCQHSHNRHNLEDSIERVRGLNNFLKQIPSVTRKTGSSVLNPLGCSDREMNESQMENTERSGWYIQVRFP